MRIVIDLQAGQGASSRRGIGRYAMTLAKALAKYQGKHEVIILLSSLLAKSVRQSFDGLLPEKNIFFWEAPTQTNSNKPENEQRNKVAELLREDFIACLRPDIVLIMSLFDGYYDNAVVSISNNNRSYKVAVIQYDLIPLLNKKSLMCSNFKKFYMQQISRLKNADMLLSISDSSARECIEELNISSDKITTIMAGAEKSFKQLRMKPKQEEHFRKCLKERYKIHKKILLNVPGGFDDRKNFTLLIDAFAKLPAHIRDQYQLVIASAYGHENKRHIKSLAKSAKLKKDEVILTNYLKDEDLIKLYNLAELFIFPSLHEGFGFPVLEAMSCGTATIAADRTSLPEVVGNKDALFDPESVEPLVNKMVQVLSDSEFKQQLIDKGLKQAKQFTWDRCAQKVINAFKKMHQQGNSTMPTDKSNEPSSQLLQDIAALSAIKPFSDLELLNIAKSIDANYDAAYPFRKK